MKRATPLTCRFYRSASGAEPVQDWLRALPKSARMVIGADLFRVQQEWPIDRPYVGQLGGGLHEVRSSWSGNEYRVLFTVKGDTAYLLHAFQKKTAAVPAHDLELAKKRLKEMLP